MNRRTIIALLPAGLLAFLGLRQARAARPKPTVPSLRTYHLWKMLDGSTLQVEGPEMPAGASYLFASFSCSDTPGQTVVMNIQQSAAVRG
jgi:hypothetical protein